MKDGLTIRIADIVQDSIVDGPGIRMTIFMQGCPHHCPGCHNPQTHDPNGGRVVSVDEVIEQMRSNPLLDGITFSGGEPLDQPQAVALISYTAHTMRKTVWCYTGYTWEEIMQDDLKKRIIPYFDYLVDGRFDASQKTLSLPWRGSRNQRIIDVTKSLCSGKIVEWSDLSENA